MTGANRRWCNICLRAGDHYTSNHPSAPLPFPSPGPTMITLGTPPLEPPMAMALRPQDVPPGRWREIVEGR